MRSHLSRAVNSFPTGHVSLRAPLHRAGAPGRAKGRRVGSLLDVLPHGHAWACQASASPPAEALTPGYPAPQPAALPVLRCLSSARRAAEACAAPALPRPPAEDTSRAVNLNNHDRTGPKHQAGSQKGHSPGVAHREDPQVYPGSSSPRPGSAQPPFAGPYLLPGAAPPPPPPVPRLRRLPRPASPRRPRTEPRPPTGGAPAGGCPAPRRTEAAAAAAPPTTPATCRPPRSHTAARLSPACRPAIGQRRRRPSHSTGSFHCRSGRAVGRVRSGHLEAATGSSVCTAAAGPDALAVIASFFLSGPIGDLSV